MAGLEPGFGINSFNRAKYKNESETIANAFLNLLFGKPGYFPSMPNLGLDIQSKLYSFWDELDTDVLKASIVSQCSAFKEYINNNSLDIIKSSYNNQPLLLIVIPVEVNMSKSNLVIGITMDDSNSIVYNYQFDESSY